VASKMESPMSRADGDDPFVYTMRDLNQRAASIISEIEMAGKPAFITRHGRFVAMITPLVPGQIESYVLAEMAREIDEPTAIGPQPPGTETRRASGPPSPDPLIEPIPSWL
jgi:antitoxin (DNA-binding transcriptional repressor) of toxin-antitoxin stability system